MTKSVALLRQHMGNKAKFVHTVQFELCIKQFEGLADAKTLLGLTTLTTWVYCGIFFQAQWHCKKRPGVWDDFLAWSPLLR